MASIQGQNPLDRFSAYFKPCTRQFSQEEFCNIKDTLVELHERQQRNPLDDLDVFFRPFNEKSDYYNDKIYNPFAEKSEIGNSIRIAKINSPRLNNFTTKISTKRRMVDSFDDEDKILPSLSTTTTSSDTSSNETSDIEGDDASELIQQDVDSISEFDDSIIENMGTLTLFSDNPKIAMTSRKIAKHKSKKQVAALDDGIKWSTTEKRDEKSRLKVVEEGKDAQIIQKKNGTPMAGFTGSRAHKYLDMLDNHALKSRHQKTIRKRARKSNLSGGLNSLLSSGFKPTNMLD